MAKRKKAVKLSAREQRVEEWFETPMLVVTLLLIFTLIIPILVPLDPVLVTIFAFFNLAIWFAYYVELGVKLAVAKSKWQGLKRNWYLIIIALSPLLLSFRFIRLSRLVSLVRLLGLQGHVNRMKKQAQERKACYYNSLNEKD